MQRVSAAIALVLLASLAGADETKKSDSGKPAQVTLTGTVVDTRCYAMSSDNFTDTHGDMQQCGAMCANMGIPAGIVKDGKKGDPAIILLAPAKSFAGAMGKTVRATGTLTWNNAAFIPDKVEVQDDKGKWTVLKVKTMM